MIHSQDDLEHAVKTIANMTGHVCVPVMYDHNDKPTPFYSFEDGSDVSFNLLLLRSVAQDCLKTIKIEENWKQCRLDIVTAEDLLHKSSEGTQDFNFRCLITIRDLLGYSESELRESMTDSLPLWTLARRRADSKLT